MIPNYLEEAKERRHDLFVPCSREARQRKVWQAQLNVDLSCTTQGKRAKRVF